MAPGTLSNPKREYARYGDMRPFRFPDPALLLSRTPLTLDRSRSYFRVVVFLLLGEGIFSFLQDTLFSLPTLPKWSSNVGYFLGDLTNLFCVFVALRLMRRLDAEIPVITLNLKRKGWLRWLVLGMCLGVALTLAHFFVLWVCCWYRITGHNPHIRLGFVVISYFIVAVWEEVCYRGYIMRVLEPKCGTLAAVLTSSVVFGWAHVIYHVQEYTLAGACHRAFMFTIAGLFYAGAFLVSRRLWFPIGIHWTMDVFITLFESDTYLRGGTYFRSTLWHDGDAWVWIAQDAVIGLLLLAIAARLGGWRRCGAVRRTD
jgi:membrane protease YdiL (CAAX protease family)